MKASVLSCALLLEAKAPIHRGRRHNGGWMFVWVVFFFLFGEFCLGDLKWGCSRLFYVFLSLLGVLLGFCMGGVILDF